MRHKSRLTITLPGELLTKVDGLVDGKAVRNRSHAIELLIRSSMEPTVSMAVILAGGKKKMTTPPALKKIGNRPLLAITLENLKKYGIVDVFVCGGIYEKQIETVFGDGSQFGVKITYVEEKKPMGTAGSLKLTEKYVASNPFLVIHGDVLTDINLEDLVEFHLRENTKATIGVKPRMSEKKFGQAFLQGNKIIRFMERGANKGISIVNTGIYVLNPEVLAAIPRSKVASMEADVFPKLAENGELSAFIFQGIWFDVSDKADHKKANVPS